MYQPFSSPGGLFSIKAGCRATSAQASQRYFVNLGRFRVLRLCFKAIKKKKKTHEVRIVQLRRELGYVASLLENPTL